MIYKYLLEPIYRVIKAGFNALYRLVKWIFDIVWMIFRPIINFLKAIAEGIYYGIGGLFGVSRQRVRR
jgi:phage-related protein